jgi:type IV pilus assembly protein PilN
MARINLLPWREELRKKQQREFGYMIVGGLLFTLFLIGLTHLFIQGKIDFQHERNSLLQSEIKILDERIKEIKEIEKTKASLLSRMEVIQQLQTSRPQIVHLFDEAIDMLPNGVYLDNMSQKGEAITLAGKAQSNARVSALMRGIEKSLWLTNPSLQKIADSDRGKTGLFTFQLKMQQTAPKTEESKK